MVAKLAARERAYGQVPRALGLRAHSMGHPHGEARPSAAEQAGPLPGSDVPQVQVRLACQDQVLMFMDQGWPGPRALSQQ